MAAQGTAAAGSGPQVHVSQAPAHRPASSSLPTSPRSNPSSASSISPSALGEDSRPPAPSGASEEHKETPPLVQVAASRPPAVASSKGAPEDGDSHPDLHGGSRFHDFNPSNVPLKMQRIFQRFLVRLPHAFIAMGATFIFLHYIMNKENFAYSASTFVGVGGTVFCFTKAFFFESIPDWMLPKNQDTLTWRRIINLTYTGFMTIVFTTAVWKLPDITPLQGFFFLGVTFALPYPFLRRLYPDIDKRPNAIAEQFGH